MRRPFTAFPRAAAVAVPLLMLACLGARTFGQEPAATSAGAREPGSDLRVFLMTFSDGSLIYEKFGHNTICIHDPNPSTETVADRAAFDAWYRSKFNADVPRVQLFLPTDKAYHYGAFDFEQENFVWRFLHGRMDYWMESDWADYSALLYAADNRSVLIQELNLPPARRLELRQFLEWNERPENRTYRYDYYRDNCSTRVRDAIDRVTGGDLARQLRPVMTDATFRSHTRRVNGRLHPLDLFWFTSFTYVLGHPVDVPLTAWEECFLPEKLAERVRHLEVPDGAGGTWPLMSGEMLFARTTRPAMPEAAPRRPVAYGAAGVLAGGAFAGLAWLAGRSRAARVGFVLLVAPWVLLWGVGATIGTYGWAVTDHAASYRNENLLQMSPLMLPLAVLAPMLAFAKRQRRGARLAVGLAVAGAGLSVVGLLLKALPPFWQHNGEIIALAVPSNIGLALALVLLARRAGTVAPGGGAEPGESPKKVQAAARSV